MSERFFASQPIAGDSFTLSGEEARHLIAVMRAQIGDEVTLFDGHGSEFPAQVAAIQKHAVILNLGPPRETSREISFELTLAVALPKGDRQKWLVEKATELGVTRLLPLTTARGVAQPVEGALDRLRRTVIEASKQCGRNRLLEIAPPKSAAELFTDHSSSALRLLADPQGTSLINVPRAERNLLIAIGPEGGFTPEELASATAANWQSVSLGPRILRIETAAVALAAWASLLNPEP